MALKFIDKCEQRVYISMHSRGEEGSRVVVFNRSYLENRIFKQSHLFTVQQKHNTLSSQINILTITYPDFFK